MAKGLFAAFVLAVGLFLLQFFLNKNNLSLSSIISPVPDTKEELSPLYPLWTPNVAQVEGASTKKIILSAKAALSYDISTDTLIFEKNSVEKLPMASLTKIMTAVIALEEGVDKRYRVSKSATAVGENAMGVTEGEVFTLEELLYGLLLPSGNDAAEVIAEGSRYGRDGFVNEMNKRGKQLGLTDTNFTNPSGLEGDGEQYSTAVDLLKLTRIAMENPTFREVVGTYEKELPYSNNHKYFRLFNDTNLLTSYPGVKGVKTGFTWEAGFCLITYLEYNDRKVIAVLLNSQNRRQEMKDLLDYTLIELGQTPPEHE